MGRLEATWAQVARLVPPGEGIRIIRYGADRWRATVDVPTEGGTLTVSVGAATEEDALMALAAEIARLPPLPQE